MGMDKVIEKKKWPARRIISYSASSAIILLLGYGLLFKGSVSTLNIRAERTTVSEVVKGPFQEFIPIIGNVKPHNTVYLDAEEGGRIEKVFVKAGTHVKEGDKILKLSNTNLLISLMNNEALISRASNDLRATRLQLEKNRLALESDRAEVDYDLTRIKRKYQRNKRLYEEELISRQAFEEYEDEYNYLVKKRKLTIESQEKDLAFRARQVDQLEASVKRMKANLELVKKQLENLILRAPVSGYLTSLKAEKGQSKAPGDRLGQIDELDGFKVLAEIDEHYISRVEKGRVGRTDLAYGSFDLTVTKVFPEVRSGKFEVDLGFVGKEPTGIKRGQTIHINLELGKASEALLLARGGFYQTTGGNWVYVLNDSGDKAVRRPVRLGRQNPRFFEVLEGLKPGDRVITSSYENFGSMKQLVLK